MTTMAFGRHAKGDADHADDVRAIMDGLARLTTKDQVRDAGHAIAALKLPLRLSHNSRIYGALALLDVKAERARTALRKACRSLINDLETPKAQPAAGKENAGAVAQRTGSTSPLRPSVAANDATNDAEASSSDDDAMPQAAPPPSSDDDMAEAPAPAAPVPAAPAPAAARRGRPADQDVLEAPVRCPGKAPKLDDLMARLLKAALIEFLLGLPAHVREADVLARGKTYFAGVAGFTFATQSLELWKALDDVTRRTLREEMRATRQAFTAAIKLCPVVILPIHPREAVVAYLKRIARLRRSEEAGRPRAKNEPSADDKLLRGREFSLEEVLKARDFVCFSGFSINATEALVKIKHSWIGVGLKRLDMAANLVRLDRIEKRRGRLTVSFDAGSMSVAEAGRKLHLLACALHFTVNREDALDVVVSRYGAAAAAGEIVEASQIPSHFRMARPVGPTNAQFLFMNQDKYLKKGHGRRTLVMVKNLKKKAGDDWGKLSDRRRGVFAARAAAINRTRENYRKEYDKRLAAAQRVALDLWRLGKVRHSRLAEFPSAPSPRELFYVGVAARAAATTMQDRYDAARAAARATRVAIKDACVLEAASRLKEQWRIVAPALPPHWRASGDASLANMGTWAAPRRYVTITVNRARALAFAQKLGLPPLGARRAPPATTRLDLESWRDIFPSTAREHATEGPLVVEPPEPERLVPAVLAGPGAVVRPRRPPIQPRRFRED